jgi:hypothetical protein
MKIHPRFLGVLLGAGFGLVAGCGPATTPTVATARPPAAPSGAAPTTAAPLTDYDKALLYTRCLTAHGLVTKDPVVGVRLGGMTFHAGMTGAEADAQQAAYDACKQYLPTTWPVKAETDPVQVARDKPYFECMATKGYPEPVPDANGNIPETTIDTTFNDPAWNAANASCEHLLDDPAVKARS